VGHKKEILWIFLMDIGVLLGGGFWAQAKITKRDSKYEFRETITKFNK